MRAECQCGSKGGSGFELHAELERTEYTDVGKACGGSCAGGEVERRAVRVVRVNGLGLDGLLVPHTITEGQFFRVISLMSIGRLALKLQYCPGTSPRQERSS